MLREMLASDELYPNDLGRLRATGYLARSYFIFNRTTWLDEVVEHTSKAFLGLTFNCTKCHDHKYDPISQKDYYRLSAFFNTAIEQDIAAPLPGETGAYLRARPQYEAKRKEFLATYSLYALQREWERKVLDAAANPGRDPKWDTAWKFLGNNIVGGQAIARLSPERRTIAQREQLSGWFLQFGIGRMDLPKEK